MSDSNIRKFEYSTLRIGEPGFTQAHFNAAVEYNDQHQSKYFTVGHKKIKFNSYVGVLQIGDLVIEILPKGDKSNDEEKWRNALIQMLKIAKYVKLDVADRASLKSSRNHLIELLFRSYMNEVAHLIHTGIVKRYITVSKILKHLKASFYLIRIYSTIAFIKSDSSMSTLITVLIIDITNC